MSLYLIVAFFMFSAKPVDVWETPAMRGGGWRGLEGAGCPAKLSTPLAGR